MDGSRKTWQWSHHPESWGQSRSWNTVGSISLLYGPMASRFVLFRAGMFSSRGWNPKSEDRWGSRMACMIYWKCISLTVGEQKDQELSSFISSVLSTRGWSRQLALRVQVLKSQAQFELLNRGLVCTEVNNQGISRSVSTPQVEWKKELNSNSKTWRQKQQRIQLLERN